MKKVPLLLTFVVTAAVAAVVLGVRNWPSEGLDADTVLARSEAAEDQVLAQLTEGKVLYFRDEVYRRHGQAASLIRQVSSEWYLPERYVQELWLEMGRGGKFIRVHGSVRSESGELLQDITTAGTQVITRDVASGAEYTTPLDLSVDDLSRAMGTSAEVRREQVESGAAAVAGGGRVADRATLIVEEMMAAPPSTADSSNANGQGYSIPYVEDITPVRWLRRTEVARDSFLALRWSVVVVSAEGRETVVEQKDRTAFAVMSSSPGAADTGP